MTVVSAFSFKLSKPVTSTALFSDITESTPEITESIPNIPVKRQRIVAKWFPFLGVKAPLLLDGTIPGDVGFDPLQFSKSEKTLYWMRDAEIKHGTCYSSLCHIIISLFHVFQVD